MSMAVTMIISTCQPTRVSCDIVEIKSWPLLGPTRVSLRSPTPVKRLKRATAFSPSRVQQLHSPALDTRRHAEAVEFNLMESLLS